MVVHNLGIVREHEQCFYIIMKYMNFGLLCQRFVYLQSSPPGRDMRYKRAAFLLVFNYCELENMFLLWLCISLGPFWNFGDECVCLGSFSKKVDLYMDNSYYMECRDDIRWKWMPNFWNNYYEHMLLLLLQANGLHITIFSLGERL